MRDTLLYIISAAALLTSCSEDVVDRQEYLEGTEKTPITVVTNLQTATPVTRAVDGKFETNDLLNAYIKHVAVADANANPLVWAADVTGTGVGPRLANFKVSALTQDHEDDADNWRDHTTTSTLQVTDAAGLYWDDFSNSVDAAHDLRTSGHALMVYYGYGYNGGTVSTALTESTGVLGWTVATDQTSGFKTSDLLYAGQQTPVAYAHGTNNTIDGRDRVLTVPYTHAMSKVTIEVICDEGFDADVTKNFGSAAVKLYQAGTVTTVTGPTKAVAKGTTPNNINMQKLTPTDAKHCSFSGLMAPTLVKENAVFATITGIDGNDYKITLTDAAIDAKKGEPAVTKDNAWSTQLAAYDAASVTPDAAKAYTQANGGLTKPGVHYMLTVTIKKQQIKVEATIQDWAAVSAEGIGQILFNNDVTDKTGDIADALKTNGFDLYKSTTTDFGAKATKVSWNSTEWTYSPKIYWQNKDDDEYFRALSNTPIADNPATNGVNESLAMSQGTDVLWGTTAAHSGTDVNGSPYNYAKSAQIDPRTGKVPLEFEHAMSKISVNLKSSGDNAVNLSGATISIINTYNEGQIDINTGDISDFNLNLTSPAVYTLNETVNGEYKLLDQIVIPQSLVNDKAGNTRETTPTFYQSAELTKIYSDGTSIDNGGSGTYYLTSDLTFVPATYYDATSANTHNAGLSGARSAGYEEKYTAEEALAYNATLDGAVKEGDPKPSPGNYTADEAKEYNAKLPGAVKEGDAKPEDGTYTAEEAATHNAGLSGAVKEGDAKPSPGNYTAAEAETFNANLPGAVSTSTTKKTYTADDANAYNATLDGAVKAGDVNVPAHYVLPDGKTPSNTDKVSHTPGELKSAGNKIMMYITLTDGTRYSIELSKCKDSSDNLVNEWKRGEHYTYEITLGKEEIIFRAIVKDWVEKNGSGNATLDWD